MYCGGAQNRTSTARRIAENVHGINSLHPCSSLHDLLRQRIAGHLAFGERIEQVMNQNAPTIFLPVAEEKSHVNLSAFACASADACR